MTRYYLKKIENVHIEKHLNIAQGSGKFLGEWG